MSQWALRRCSHGGFQLYFALFALLALAGTAALLQGRSVSGDAPSLSAPADIPATKTSPAGDTAKQAAGAQAKLPLAFVPNRGQTDQSVRYYAEGTGHSFYFTPKRAVLSFTGHKKGVALHLTPLGASPDMRLIAGERAPGKVNYLIGSEQHRNLPTYRELTYENVWPGVDLVFRGQGGTLKYELRAQAGADLSQIALAYGGADGLSVAKSGALLISTPLGTLRDARPVSYQQIGGKRVPVKSRYALGSGNSYGFALGSSYDPRQPLVIDPGIEYSTYLGGSGTDRAAGVAVDGAGSAYVIGNASSGFPTTAGAFDESFNGGAQDAYVAKLNPSGSALDYSTYIGGATSSDSGSAIAVDGSGSAYITGSTAATDFPTTAGAYDTTYNGGSGDAFVTKLSPDGSALEYSTYLGGTSGSGFSDYASGIAIDGSGAAYVAGGADSTNFPTTAGAFDTTQNGGEDEFVTKLNPAGSSLVYSTYVGGSSFDSALALAVDGSGNAYLAGYGTSSNYPTTGGAFDTSYNDGWDAHVAKLNASGTALEYATYLGGFYYEEARGIAVDAAGSAYVTGHTASNGTSSTAPYPTTAGAYDTTYNGGYDVFVTKLDPSGGSLSYSTLLGGTDDGYDEYAEGVAVDASGRAYVAGTTAATNFPTEHAIDSTYNGGAYDAYVAELGAAGDSLDFSTYLGGSSDDRGNAIAVNGVTGRIYVAGQTNSSSSSFPITPGTVDTTYNGGFDAFVTKLAPIGSTLAREEPAVVQQSLPDSTGYATGSINVQLPNRLLGIDPGELVAFRFDGGWQQIPVQVDEREVMDLNRIYTTSRPTCSDPCYSNPPNGGAVHPEFTDPNTWVGPDTDATLDSNDEVALMASDAGGSRTTSYAPAGVDAGTAVEVKITDPIDGSAGYAYLFKTTTGLDPAAGQDYVDYDFNLTNGPYKTGAYNPTNTTAGNGMNFGPRPETSFVTTDAYHRGFTDRWYDNELRITRGAATGVDILDRHDDQFDAIDASCVRTQDTFRQGEGAFIVNKDGPVRAIRDFIGANSGPHVQRQHIFYDKLEVINTYLRVHPIPGVVDFFDYSAAGQGLTYENGVITPGGLVNGTPPGGVTIDGQQDAVTGAGTSLLPGYESVDGPQGSLTMTQKLLTNNPDPGYHIVYRDGNLLGPNPCTGDDSDIFGASGPQLNSAVNNTDEANRLTSGGGQFSNVFYERDIHYGAPGQADGPARLAETQQPLELQVNEVDLNGVPGTIIVRKDAVPDDPQDFDFTAGGGLSPASFSLDDDSDGTLSNTQTFSDVDPGTYSISEASTSNWDQTSATCDDGSPPSAIDLGSGETVTCTFTNSRIYGYARPLSATPATFALVPAFEPCTASDSTHAAPLALPSCNPPVQTSDYLTLGAPDVNGNPAVSRGRLFLKVLGETPINPSNGDQADVEITASITDVRNQADLTDYTGELRALLDLRITDRLNGAALKTPATADDVSFSFNINCSATGTSEGGACNVQTTADAVTADAVREGKRAIWELGQVQVYDGGSDGDADTTGDNTLFEVQGLFAP